MRGYDLRMNDRKDRNDQTRDGEPLHDRGTIESRRDEADKELEEMEEDPPVDESDDGPQPVLPEDGAE